jgi:hypothetical protein
LEIWYRVDKRFFAWHVQEECSTARLGPVAGEDVTRVERIEWVGSVGAAGTGQCQEALVVVARVSNVVRSSDIRTGKRDTK